MNEDTRAWATHGRRSFWSAHGHRVVAVAIAVVLALGAWYAYEKYTGGKKTSAGNAAPESLDSCIIHREDSQLTLDSSASPRSCAKAAFNDFVNVNSAKYHSN